MFSLSLGFSLAVLVLFQDWQIQFICTEGPVSELQLFGIFQIVIKLNNGYQLHVSMYLYPNPNYSDKDTSIREGLVLLFSLFTLYLPSLYWTCEKGQLKAVAVLWLKAAEQISCLVPPIFQEPVHCLVVSTVDHWRGSGCCGGSYRFSYTKVEVLQLHSLIILINILILRWLRGK